MTILVIQNSEYAPLGVLEECLKEYALAAEILVMPSAESSLPQNISGYKGVIILGGPMNAEEDSQYPFLKKVVETIKRFADTRKPILGVCLGAQLIARAFSKRVYKHDVVEIGFTPLYPVQEIASEDPLLNSALARVSESLHLMQWHYDTFDLPDQAELLVTGTDCRNQAYRIGSNIYGFQFHFEVNRSIIEVWLEADKKLRLTRDPDLPQKLSQQIDLYFEQSRLFCLSLGCAWLELTKLAVLDEY